jgi:hypothetical protein
MINRDILRSQCCWAPWRRRELELDLRDAENLDKLKERSSGAISQRTLESRQSGSRREAQLCTTFRMFVWRKGCAVGSPADGSFKR